MPKPLYKPNGTRKELIAKACGIGDAILIYTDRFTLKQSSLRFEPLCNIKRHF